MIGILILSFFLLKALPKTCIICCNAFFYLKKQNSKQKIGVFIFFFFLTYKCYCIFQEKQLKKFPLCKTYMIYKY